MSLDLIEKIKNSTNVEKILLIAEFYAGALTEFMPFPPDVWHGTSSGKNDEEKENHIRLVWFNEVSGASIEMFISDRYMGNFNVNGNKTGFNWICTEKAARECFKSAFRYIFGTEHIETEQAEVSDGSSI